MCGSDAVIFQITLGTSCHCSDFLCDLIIISFLSGLFRLDLQIGELLITTVLN